MTDDDASRESADRATVAVISLAILAVIGALLAGLFVSAARAAEWRAIDGDTIKLVEPIAGTKRSKTLRIVRLWGIDAPETGRRAACDLERRLGEAAKAEVIRLLVDARRVRIDRREVREKYGRELAGVLITTSSGARVDVGARLIDLDLARPWLGHGRRPIWCPGG